MIFDYINPLIGDIKLEEVTMRTMDKYYQSLLTVKAKVVRINFIQEEGIIKDILQRLELETKE